MRPAATLAACAACLCCLLVAMYRSDSRPIATSEDGLFSPATLTALKHLHAKNAEESRLRAALKSLEGNLEGELQSIKKILLSSAQERADEGTEGSGMVDNIRGGSDSGRDKDAEAADNSEPCDAEEKNWSKRTMQRGALQGESVQDQLQRVLQHEMKVLLKKEAKWHDEKDLKVAEKEADFIRAHPLPMPDARAGSEQDENQDDYPDRYDAQDDDDRAALERFSRNQDGLSAEQYRTLVKALEEAIRQEENSGSTERAPRGEAAQAGRDNQGSPHREARAPASRTFLPWKAAQDVPYSERSQGEVMELARSKGRNWVDKEILREHGEFVRLPPRDVLPLPVLPYWQRAR